jgi:hypothetical protein
MSLPSVMRQSAGSARTGDFWLASVQVLSIGFELLACGEEDASRAVDANVLLQFGRQDRERPEKAPIDCVIGDSLADFLKGQKRVSGQMNRLPDSTVR